MSRIEEMKKDYDWEEAFAYADFELHDVEEIIKDDAGANDEASWLAVGRLKDGRYFFLSAWCDYTGWDCQAGGSCEFADSLDALIRWRLGDEDRARLGYVLPPETDGAPLSVIKE